MKRDTSISICKGIAIILMVVGHAEAPALLSSFIYEFHMPLFFITAGHFFSLKYLDREADFVKRRLKGLYVPFVEWSLFFLIIHNWMFRIGILNEQYGNVTGGVTHPYGWHQAEQNIWNIFFSMGGYDEFLAGAFWFFRALLVASVLYLVLFKVFTALDAAIQRRQGRDYESPQASPRVAVRIGVVICVFLFLIILWKTMERLNIVTLVQKGDRDLVGCLFFGVGFLFRYCLERIPRRWWLTLAYAAVVLAFAKWYNASMTYIIKGDKFLALILPAVLGFLMTYNVSKVLDRHDNLLRRFLIYCGDNTLCIFVLHIVSFKVVSLIKIAYYGLDPLQIGCHMVIHDHSGEDLFWVLYSVAGVGIPLTVNYLYHKLQSQCVRKGTEG